MTVVLSISSQVARGHVGNSATGIVLQSMGIDIWPVPTVVLSNHPGHGATAGLQVPASKINEMLEMLDEWDWLGEVDALLTGYIVRPEQVEAAAMAVRRVKSVNPNAIYCCDPILGDGAKGLYVTEEIAQAVQRTLIPRADLVTPNLFELGWLSGRTVGTSEEIVAAASALGLPATLVTSAPAATPDHLANLLITPDEVHTAETPRLDRVPNGTGDLMTALMLGHHLSGTPNGDALDRATKTVAAVIAASAEAHSDELLLVANRHLFGLE